MRTIRLTLEYDGTDFQGWQVQKDARTVQGELEKVLEEILKEPVRVVGAGRTDAGVHALGQVAHFRTEKRIPLDGLRKGLNALLPDDVVVLEAAEAAPDFHARFSATGRAYRYVITRRRRAIGRHYAYFCEGPLDLSAMQRAAEQILGEHDFRAFCQASAEVNHYRCHVRSARWEDRGEEIWFEIEANRFLHNMVRILVGTMMEIGRGFWTVERIRELLASGDRTEAGRTVPPHGLYLLRVMYD